MSLFFLMKASGSAPIPDDVITLSGSTGTPNDKSHSTVDPTTANAGWEFNTNGSITFHGDSSGTFQAGVEWCQQDPVDDYWIRATLNGGQAANGSSITYGTWYALAGAGEAQRILEWVKTSPDGPYIGSAKVEICTVGDGSNIVATGYYQGTAVIEP